MYVHLSIYIYIYIYVCCHKKKGTNATRLSRNVAYNVWGMCYYLEDGVEERNLLEYNLASHVHPIGRPANGPSGQGKPLYLLPFSDIRYRYWNRPVRSTYNMWNIIMQITDGETFYSSPDLFLPADSSASGFYIPNAYNTFIGNAASGMIITAHKSAYHLTTDHR
jgi:hypothetical protein